MTLRFAEGFDGEIWVTDGDGQHSRWVVGTHQDADGSIWYGCQMLPCECNLTVPEGEEVALICDPDTINEVRRERGYQLIPVPRRPDNLDDVDMVPITKGGPMGNLAEVIEAAHPGLWQFAKEIIDAGDLEMNEDEAIIYCYGKLKLRGSDEALCLAIEEWFKGPAELSKETVNRAANSSEDGLEAVPDSSWDISQEAAEAIRRGGWQEVAESGGPNAHNEGRSFADEYNHDWSEPLGEAEQQFINEGVEEGDRVTISQNGNPIEDPTFTYDVVRSISGEILARRAVMQPIQGRPTHVIIDDMEEANGP